MALRDQPYIPLYIQDYMTDEKLNMCSWEAQGIYIKIMCVLHKQRDYGKILFKQTSKQTESSIEYYASILVRQIPCQMENMINALNELVYYEVLGITESCLYQKRMVKDGQISDIRSKAAKKGGGNPILFKQTSKQKPKQTDKQITEYENEYEYNSIKGGAGEIKDLFTPDNIQFMDVVNDWFAYKKERKESYKSDRSKKAFITRLQNLSGNSISVAEEIIRTSMGNNWAGIFAPNKNNKMEAQRNTSEGQVVSF
ncbi:MAG: hypothetical protein PHS04_09845 [Tissierellia bacterium]|nr:hypothetical protein [Tissierellia bacterium]